MDTGKESKPAGHARAWREEEDGVIYILLTSNGMTGEQWINHYKSKGIKIEALAKKAILSEKFKPTKGAKIEIAILKDKLLKDKNLTVDSITALAVERHLTPLSIEAACLIRDMFTDEEFMGKMHLSLVTFMHETLHDSNGVPFWLDADCEFGGDWLGACYDPFDRQNSLLGCQNGFVFTASQVDPQD